MNFRIILPGLFICLLSAAAAGAQTTAKLRKQKHCVVQGNEIKEVDVNYNTKTGDFTVTRNGKEVPQDDAYPTDKTYAAGATWYINNEVITVKSRKYVKYGLPRVLGISDVKFVVSYKGVPVFAEAPTAKKIEVVYLPVRTGCEFQPYQLKVN